MCNSNNFIHLDIFIALILFILLLFFFTLLFKNLLRAENKYSYIKFFILNSNIVLHKKIILPYKSYTLFYHINQTLDNIYFNSQKLSIKHKNIYKNLIQHSTNSNIYLIPSNIKMYRTKIIRFFLNFYFFINFLL